MYINFKARQDAATLRREFGDYANHWAERFIIAAVRRGMAKEAIRWIAAHLALNIDSVK